MYCTLLQNLVWVFTSEDVTTTDEYDEDEFSWDFYFFLGGGGDKVIDTLISQLRLHYLYFLFM